MISYISWCFVYFSDHRRGWGNRMNRLWVDLSPLTQNMSGFLYRGEYRSRGSIDWWPVWNRLVETMKWHKNKHCYFCFQIPTILSSVVSFQWTFQWTSIIMFEGQKQKNNRKSICLTSVVIENSLFVGSWRAGKRNSKLDPPKDIHPVTYCTMFGCCIHKAIPCSTKKNWRFFSRISSVCRNVETKGKVFWK